MADPLIYCLQLLGRRMYSRAELERALKRRGVDEVVSKQLLEQLTEQGLVNDRKFAESWMRTRDVLAPRGASLLRAELVKKGIDKDLIQEVLQARRQLAEEEPEEQENELDLARQLLARKERQYAHLAPEVRKRRLTALLMRRGFPYEVIRRIIEL